MKSSKQRQIEQLELRNTELSVELATLNDRLGALQKSSAETEGQLNEHIAELEAKNEQKQSQLDAQELKKFAQAFEAQESAYQNKAATWFWQVKIAFALVAIAILAVIGLSKHETTWHHSLSYVFIDVLAVTYLVFTLKQYSYYVKLGTDYGNRKTLAQSYQHIVSSEDDAIIKGRFLDQASSVLAAKAEVDDDAHTMPEKVLDTINNLAKAVPKIKP